jgi:hypothetical protein
MAEITKDISQYLDNKEHDSLFKAKRVTDVGSDNQILIDEATAGTTYVGSGARGLATATTGWLLTKIVEAGTDTTIQHAIDAWTNRSSTAVYS